MAAAVFPQYVAQKVEQLVLKERVMSLSGDSFSVKTTEGTRIVDVKGEALSLSGRKHVSDINGQPLFDLRKEHFSIHTTYYAENPQGEKILVVKNKFSSEIHGHLFQMHEIR